MQLTLDSGSIAAAFHRKAMSYDHHVLVQKRIVRQLADSIALHQSCAPEHILDVGTGTGALLENLHVRYPHARMTGVDVAHNMCLRTRQKLGADCALVTGAAENLPFRSGTFDLIVSSSVLQWVADITGAFLEMRRVVRPGGTISTAFFCQGTLGELQSCFRDATDRYRSGADHTASRLHGFQSVDDVKSMVDSMDFERAVVAVETEVDWYDDVYSLLRSIKNIGAGTVTGGPTRGLGWRGLLQETSRLYQERFGVNGRIPVTYKVLYLSAQTGTSAHGQQRT